MNEELTRRLLIEQTRKELLDDLHQYLVGVIFKGQMMVRKTTDITNGRILIIPDAKYECLFGGK